MNEALMMKLAYAILRNEDTFQIKVLWNKYKCGETGSPTIIYKPGDSNIWKGIIKIWDKVIQEVYIPQNNATNLVKWNLTNGGEFMVKSTYSFIVGGSTNNNRSILRAIWRSPCPKRVKTFIWLLLKNKLLINDCKVAKHLSIDDSCPRCRMEIETCLYAIRDYSKVKDCWYRLVHPHHWQVFFLLDLADWIHLNLNRGLARDKDGHWRM